MSEWGDLIEALEAEVRATETDLPGGVQGWERGVRRSDDLLEGELPHVFAHDPTETSELLEHGQERVFWSVELNLWTRGETQEELALRLDRIRDAIRANPTLGGRVRNARVSVRSLREYPGRAEKAGILIVETERVD